MEKLRVVAICLVVKLALLGFHMLIYQFWPDQDESTQLLFEEGQTPLLSVTARWDSHFFISIAREGHAYEKNHAFFGLYPQILGVGTRALQAIFDTSFNYTIIVFALLLNLLLNSINSVLLYEITRIKFPKHGSNFPLVVATLYQFSPSSAFYTAVYSESLFSFFIFAYVYTFTSRYEAIAESKRGIHLFQDLSGYAFTLVPTMILATSIFARSNGMFWVAVVGFPILEAFAQNIIDAVKGRAKFSFAVARNTVFWGVLNIVVTVIPFVIVLKKAEHIYCVPDNIHGPIAEWCQGLLPNVYGFIQSRYWDVGFLTYYQVSRIFLIIWGLYTFTLIGSSLFKYAKSLRKVIQTNLGISPAKQVKAKGGETEEELSIFSYGNLHAHMIYTTFLLYISVFYAHTQSSTRFFSSDPALYWFIADFLFKTNSKKQSKKSLVTSGLVFFYLAHFTLSGSFLFANYIIWT